MTNSTKQHSIILGGLLCTGLIGMGLILGMSMLRYREFERSVTVKGLSEQEYRADTVIWPIEFTVLENDLAQLYATLQQQTALISDFLQQSGISDNEITIAVPGVEDRYSNQFRGNERAAFRYMASRRVTVYSSQVAQVRSAMQGLSELGSQGLVLTGNNWRGSTQYLFTRLNEVKPAMVEEATRNARQVAMKFAEDSQSRLGRIRQARQGQFSISDRDANNPHIKTVRVVSTIEYYLAD